MTTTAPILSVAAAGVDRLQIGADDLTPQALEALQAAAGFNTSATLCVQAILATTALIALIRKVFRNDP